MNFLKNDDRLTDSKSGVMKKVLYAFATVLLLANVYSIVYFVTGVAPIFDKPLNPVSAIQISASIFNMNGLWYWGVFSAGFSFAYLVLLCFMIRGFVKSIPTLKSFFTDDMSDREMTKENVLTYGRNVGWGFLASITFAMVCYMMRAYLVKPGLYILIAFWGIIWISKRAIFYVLDGQTGKNLLIKLSCDLLVALPVFVLMIYAMQPSFNDFRYHFRQMFSVTDQGLIGTIESLLLMAILIWTLVRLFHINDSVSLFSYNTKQSVNFCLVMCIALFATSIAEQIADGIASFGVDMILNSLLEALPYILVSSSIFIVGNLPKDVEEEKTNEATVDSDESAPDAEINTLESVFEETSDLPAEQ